MSNTKPNTVEFIYSEHCNSDMYTEVVDVRTAKYNLPIILDASLDCIIVEDSEAKLYVPHNGPIGIESLMRVVDNPELTYDPEINKVFEHALYYYSERHGVICRVEPEYDINGYSVVDKLYVVRSCNKLSAVNNFIYNHLTKQPMNIPDGMNRDSYLSLIDPISNHAR